MLYSTNVEIKKGKAKENRKIKKAQLKISADFCAISVRASNIRVNR